MTGITDPNKLNWPRWQQFLLIAFLVLMIGNRLASNIDSAAYRAGLLGAVALEPGRSIPDPNAPIGFGKMIEVDPSGQIAKAGISNGDYVRTDPGFYNLMRPVVGDRVNFTLYRDGILTEHQFVVEPLPPGHVQARSNVLRLVNLLAVLVSMLVGCFVLWRGWGNKTAMLLGAALVALGRGGSGPSALAAELGLVSLSHWLLIIFIAAVALLIPFAMRLFEQQAGPLPRWHWRLFHVWFAWCFVSATVYHFDRVWMTSYITWAGNAAYPSIAMSISLSVALAYLVAAYRKGATTERSRLALIIFSLSAYLLAAILIGWDASQTGSLLGPTGQIWLIYPNALMVGIIAPGLLAYAVLRHKLFDLGFAVNRTLVFGAVGLLLLVSFALIEWAIKQAIPKVWYGGSVYISAMIAVGLYLTFNRLHHRVEHAIERIFFHKWQVNEAKLRRFVAAAAHMEKPEALAPTFVAELTRFTGGAAVALSARTPEGKYADADGAQSIDADDLALAAMRAEQNSVVPAEVGSPLAAALALPMLHQAALAGFVLLGPKPTGEDYRPDEIEVLGWATHQIGLDLQAIRVRELETAVVTLEASNRTLAEIVTKAALATD